MKAGLDNAIDFGRPLAAAATLMVACTIVLSASAAIAATNPASSKILTCKDALGNPILTDPSDPRCYKPPPNEAERAVTEERRRRESLEKRVEEAERGSAIRAELQRLGVAKIELAYKAVRDEVPRDSGEMKNFLEQFVGENPELLPARLAGGSGASGGPRGSQASGAVDIERIRPGMSAEELDRVRQEIARVASQTLRGF